VDATRDAVWLLDGCAFQSTVRFMFEQDADLEEIRRYWSRTEETLAATPTAVVYLEQSDPRAYMRDETIASRGQPWLSKIVAHVESTPRARGQALHGVDGTIEFWMQYRSVCDDLLARSRLPVVRLDCTERTWADVEDLACEQISEKLRATSARA
jgi:hypothetical protein